MKFIGGITDEEIRAKRAHTAHLDASAFTARFRYAWSSKYSVD
jgi:hypothetical protein